MTKPVAWALPALWLLAAVVALPDPASAHGAPASREVDLRVLLDDDGGLGYGGCGPAEEAGVPCAPEPEGLDVLALDVREAFLGTQPAVAFRMVVQSAAVHDGRGLLLSLTANGTEHAFAVQSPDGTAYTSTDFDLLEGPFDVGDGHPKALDGWLLLSTLGVRVGDSITGIHLDSTHHDEPDDVMPGTYYSNGAEMPHLPHDPADPGEALEEHLPGTYAVKGPAPLVTFEATPAVVDLARDGNTTLRLTNPLAATTQSVTVAIEGEGRFPDGAATTNVSLDPGATRDLVLHWPLGASGGNVTVVATSDLGARVERSIQAVPAPAPNATAQAPTAGGKDTPAPAVLPLLIAVVAAVASRRRRL